MAAQTQENIEEVVFHKSDDATLGEVFFMPPFGTNTGIDDINAASTAAGGQYYNMLGQPVAHPTTGFYILNGKKVFVK